MSTIYEGPNRKISIQSYREKVIGTKLEAEKSTEQQTKTEKESV
ncbi:hypothetical protein ACIQAA_25800 [Neobacillus sp. NPDC093182]